MVFPGQGFLTPDERKRQQALEHAPSIPQPGPLNGLAQIIAQQQAPQQQAPPQPPAPRPPQFGFRLGFPMQQERSPSEGNLSDLLTGSAGAQSIPQQQQSLPFSRNIGGMLLPDPFPKNPEPETVWNWIGAGASPAERVERRKEVERQTGSADAAWAKIAEDPEAARLMPITGNEAADARIREYVGKKTGPFLAGLKSGTPRAVESVKTALGLVMDEQGAQRAVYALEALAPEGGRPDDPLAGIPEFLEFVAYSLGEALPMMVAPMAASIGGAAALAKAGPHAAVGGALAGGAGANYAGLLRESKREVANELGYLPEDQSDLYAGAGLAAVAESAWEATVAGRLIKLPWQRVVRMISGGKTEAGTKLAQELKQSIAGRVVKDATGVVKDAAGEGTGEFISEVIRLAGVHATMNPESDIASAVTEFSADQWKEALLEGLAGATVGGSLSGGGRAARSTAKYVGRKTEERGRRRSRVQQADQLMAELEANVEALKQAKDEGAAQEAGRGVVALNEMLNKLNGENVKDGFGDLPQSGPDDSFINLGEHADLDDMLQARLAPFMQARAEAAAAQRAAETQAREQAAAEQAAAQPPPQPTVPEGFDPGPAPPPPAEPVQGEPAPPAELAKEQKRRFVAASSDKNLTAVRDVLAEIDGIDRDSLSVPDRAIVAKARVKAEKNYNRLAERSEGRLPQDDAAPETWSVPEGEPATVNVPEFGDVTVQHAVVPLESLRHSRVEGYDRGLQDRRGDQESDAAVQKIVDEFTPPRLMPAAIAQEGPPIVTPFESAGKRDVEIGNHRVMAIQQIYEGSPEKAAAYLEALAEAGFETEGVDNPVLVRVRAGEPLTGEQKHSMTRRANKPQTQSLSSSEQATNLINVVPGDIRGEPRVAQADGHRTRRHGRRQGRESGVPRRDRGRLRRDAGEGTLEPRRGRTPRLPHPPTARPGGARPRRVRQRVPRRDGGRRPREHEDHRRSTRHRGAAMARAPAEDRPWTR